MMLSHRGKTHFGPYSTSTGHAVITRITDNPWHFMFLEMLIRNVTAISILGGLVLMTLIQIVKSQGSIQC